MADGRIATPKTEITGKNGFASKGVLGRAKTLTGTFSSSGKIVTVTDGALETELGGGKYWLYSTSDNEVRAFTQYNGNIIHLEQAFTSDQTDEPMIVYIPQYISISARNTHATNDSQLNNRKFAAGEIDNYNFEGGITPITYDAASGALSGEITFKLAY